VKDIPEGWPELHQRLLLAVERAINELANQSAPQPTPSTAGGGAR
jgi:hypothetical protein